MSETFEWASISRSMGWTNAVGWNELLQSQRVLMVSEAGAGKTFECRAEQAALWNEGVPSFYFELAELARNAPLDLLNADEQDRFDAWLSSQSDIAFFFLDSVDELKLTLGSFESALKRLSRALSGQLGRAHIVVTSRPIPIDQALIRKHLPVPTSAEAIAGEDAFADIMMSKARDTAAEDSDNPPIWRNVSLMPLSDEQIRQVAALQGIEDATPLLDDIRRRNAQEFAGRPHDLIELCADWQNHRSIRTHREQVAYNVEVKLKASADRERAQLSQARGWEGASRLALACLLTRKLTLRHSAAADRGGAAGTALDSAAILRDWTPEEREVLLERPLFGFASYGRVRFHHRSVLEYLAAQRLEYLLGRGMSLKAVKRILFTQTPTGIKAVKPSMRPVAAWLALTRASVLEEIRDREPEVLLEHGDPESLPPERRTEALRAYVNLYGSGTWRGLHVPRVQLHRFASADLMPEVVRLWAVGVENVEVRELLLQIMAAAPTRECAEIALSVALCATARTGERVDAIDVLVALPDHRIDLVTQSMDAEPHAWPDSLLKNLLARLVPKSIAADRVSRILGRLTTSRRDVNALNYSLVPVIASEAMPDGYLDILREELTALSVEGVRWHEAWPHIESSRPHLLSVVAAICLRQLNEGESSDSLFHSIVVVLRLSREADHYLEKRPLAELRKTLSVQSASIRRRLFWIDDAYSELLHPQDTAWRRLYEASHRGAIRLDRKRDCDWVFDQLRSIDVPLAERHVLLEAASHEMWDHKEDRSEYLGRIQKQVSDSPELLRAIAELLKPAPVDPELTRMEAEDRKRTEQGKRRIAKNKASWTLFWREVASNPTTAFSPDRAGRTAWNLWQAMDRAGDESRSSGWNRRFIEKHFGTSVADSLRVALAKIWRSDRPSLRSERPEDGKNSFLIRWQLGLAGVAAEAEDPNWARKLSVEEAELAVRYAPLELNGFPSWLDSLASAHPVAVVGVLGPEIAAELIAPASENSSRISLQNVSYATPAVASLFVPTIKSWFETNAHTVGSGEDPWNASERLSRVIDILLKHGDEGVCHSVTNIASQQLSQRGMESALATVWMPTLMRLDPAQATELLEQDLTDHALEETHERSESIVILFSDLHGRGGINLSSPAFTPSLLLRLIRLAHRSVNSKNDVEDEGEDGPAKRDDAERGRNALVSALLETSGQGAWRAKLEIAEDPVLASWRDRILTIAREKEAEQCDATALSDAQVVVIDSQHEAPPATTEDVFALLVDRLDDIGDLLLRDDSPRATWGLINEERIMRREIARVLRQTASGLYSVDQEGVTADEKETDIRLRMNDVDLEGVIELKLGDGRSGRDLRDTIREQLVLKYMAPQACRSGCLLVTVNHTRQWDDPDSGARIAVEGLEAWLKQEAEKVAAEMGGLLQITARVLDLRARLTIEGAAATT